MEYSSSYVQNGGRPASPPYASLSESLLRARFYDSDEVPELKAPRSSSRRKRQRAGLPATSPDPPLQFIPDVAPSTPKSIQPEDSETADDPVCDERNDAPFQLDQSDHVVLVEGVECLGTGRSEGSRIYRIRQPFVVEGSADLTVLEGSVNILCHIVTPQSKNVRIFSMLSPYVLTIAPIAPSKRQLATEEVDGSLEVERPVVPVPADWVAPNAVEPHVVIELAPVHCFAQVQQAFPQFSRRKEAKFAGTQCPGQVDSVVHMGKTGRPQTSPDPRLVETLALLPKSTKAAFKEWSEWPAVVTALSRGSKLRLVICGEAGTGKSMLARCVVNHLLNLHKAVVYVETDVGQPELSPAGLIATHVLKEPLLGSPATHNRRVCLAGRYFGETTPRENPVGYARAVRDVISAGVQYSEGQGVPLICNTDGWVSGTGASLLDHVVRTLEPTHALCVRFARGGGESTRMRHPDVLERCVSSVATGFSMWVESPVSATRNGARHPGSMLREVGLMSYFGESILNGTDMYRVGLGDVRVGFIGECVPATHVLAALNGSIVALCRTDGGVLEDLADWEAVGLGFVRAIEVGKECAVHICTPVATRIVEECDGLLMSGGLQAPAALYFWCAEGSEKGFVGKPWPYVARGVIGSAGPMRSRTTLRRD